MVENIAATVLLQHWFTVAHVKALPSIPTLFFGFEPGLRTRLPHIPWISPVNRYTVYEPWKKYERARSDLIAFPSFLSPTSAPHLSHKPLHMQRYTGFDVFGKTLLSTQTGPEHKRHWSVVKRCFSDRQMASVWDAMRWSLDTFIEEEVNQGEDGVVVDEESVLLQIILPPVMQMVPLHKLQRFWRARKAFLEHLEQMYLDKRAELRAEGISFDVDKVEDQASKDLLGALVHSQLNVEQEARLQKGDEKVAGLTKSEIIGNMWLLIFAGHETSGHTLVFAVAYLALYPHWQESVYNEIINACGDEQPTYSDMHKLPLASAVCLETLRLRDIVSTIMKEAVTDVVVPYTSWDSKGNLSPRTHLVKKGSLFVVDSSATSLNPHAWGPQSMEFNPRRRLGSTPPFTSFSLGARQCLGKRFAEVEMTSFISGICRNFKILPVRAHEDESWEEMKARMIDSATEQNSFQPGKFSVRLQRR
uniref:Cytochrome P450 n=1 Tax=Kwoniella bestiolae CBS 10118 TaxID=1296100 RepID=A0A1B9FUM4_9TREE|nr:hypothetical protein I302_08115 [Kwoniella bestiolae CBS 10118]OCF22466.1 hypothetical protein I302_08115 [Kwoniella bestiolae CBS 10118]